MNFFRHTFSFLTHSGSGIWCLLLVVIAAQTRLPMPVVHDHDSWESSGALDEHLQRSHVADEDVALSLTGESGLHWHWVLPCQGKEGDRSEHHDPTLPCPELAASPHQIVVSQSNPIRMWLNDSVRPNRSVDTLPVSISPISPCRLRSLSDLYCLTAAQTCAVLCVIRC